MVASGYYHFTILAIGDLLRSGYRWFTSLIALHEGDIFEVELAESVASVINNTLLSTGMLSDGTAVYVTLANHLSGT